MWCTGLVAPRHVGSSWTRARTRVPCTGRRIPNHSISVFSFNVTHTPSHPHTHRSAPLNSTNCQNSISSIDSAHVQGDSQKKNPLDGPQVQLQLCILTAETVTRHTVTSVTLAKYGLHVSHQGAERVKSAHSWPYVSLFRNHAHLLLCLYKRVKRKRPPRVPNEIREL